MLKILFGLMVITSFSVQAASKISCQLVHDFVRNPQLN
jgi:hypothetical protein